MNISLVKYAESAKLFNSREALFEAEENTDYSKIANMSRDFAPFSTLWKAVHGWKTGKEIWVNDEWNTIDAIGC